MLAVWVLTGFDSCCAVWVFFQGIFCGFLRWFVDSCFFTYSKNANGFLQRWPDRLGERFGLGLIGLMWRFLGSHFNMGVTQRYDWFSERVSSEYRGVIISAGFPSCFPPSIICIGNCTHSCIWISQSTPACPYVLPFSTMSYRNHPIRCPSAWRRETQSCNIAYYDTSWHLYSFSETAIGKMSMKGGSFFQSGLFLAIFNIFHIFSRRTIFCRNYLFPVLDMFFVFPASLLFCLSSFLCLTASSLFCFSAVFCLFASQA